MYNNGVTRAQISPSPNYPIVSASNSSSSAKSPLSFRGLRSLARYIASHDLPRGIVHAGQSALKFTLMLGVMYVYYCSVSYLLPITIQDFQRWIYFVHPSWPWCWGDAVWQVCCAFTYSMTVYHMVYVTESMEYNTLMFPEWIEILGRYCLITR